MLMNDSSNESIRKEREREILGRKAFFLCLPNETMCEWIVEPFDGDVWNTR